MKSETVERHFTFTQNNIFPIIEDDSCSLKNMLQTVAKDAVCPTTEQNQNKVSQLKLERALTVQACWRLLSHFHLMMQKNLLCPSKLPIPKFSS